ARLHWRRRSCPPRVCHEARELYRSPVAPIRGPSQLLRQGHPVPQTPAVVLELLEVSRPSRPFLAEVYVGSLLSTPAQLLLVYLPKFCGASRRSLAPVSRPSESTRAPRTFPLPPRSLHASSVGSW
ncbi:unnamed protein product, partial [Ectocarpus sp. 12 AP-2014]